MTLKAVLTPDEHTALDEHFQELYTERDGQFELTGIQGVKSEADVQRLKVSLEKERSDHKSTRDKYKVWGELDHTEVMSQLDRIPELETAAADKIDEAALEEMAEKRAVTRLKPLERKNAELIQQLTERDEKIYVFETKDTRRIVSDALFKAGKESKMVDPQDAIQFGLPYFNVTEDGEVLTEEGVTPDQFLIELQQKSGHLWGATEGGGARGGTGGGNFGKNPYTHENWSLTEQGRIYTENASRAEAMCKAAGAGTCLRPVKPGPKKS